MKEIQGNHANCVVIAVYGNRAYDDGLLQLKDTAELCGFNVIASVAAVAEHSIMRQFGSGRPDEEDSKELKKFAEEILEKLSSDKELSTDYFVPGSHEYKRLGNLSVVPKANAPALAVGNVPKPAQQVQSIKIISEPAIAANVSVVWDVSPPVQKVSGS